MEQFINVVALFFGSIIVVFTILLDKFCKNKICRFIPLIGTLIIGIICLIKAIYFSHNIEVIGYTIISITNFFASIYSLITLFVLYLIKHSGQPKRLRHKIEN